MQLCFCLYFCVHFLTRPLNRIDNDNVRNEPHTRTRRPAEFKRGMHQTNNDILWFGNERRVITYLLVLMHANTRNKFRNQCEQKCCCGIENRCIGKHRFRCYWYSGPYIVKKNKAPRKEAQMESSVIRAGMLQSSNQL